MHKSILLIGSGGHARACIDVIEQNAMYTISGLIGLKNEVGSKVLSYPVLGTDEDIPELLEEYGNALITVGQIKSPETRIRLFDAIEADRYSPPAIVSPYAYVSSHADIGVGTIVMHGAVVNAGAVIGQNCIINSRSLVEHDAVVANHCHISTGAVINGGVKIGDGCFIGSGAIIRQSISIAEYSIIGMGQHVLENRPTGEST